MKINEITPVFVESMPDIINEGELYISAKYETAIHLCACGCGVKTVTPLGKDGWFISIVDGKVGLRPSIGNFSGENPYHAHYYITHNKIEWL